MDKIQDSGDRTEFSTGAQRDLAGLKKGRYDLITPIALRRLAIHYKAGTVKYSDRNWEKGMPLHCYLDSAIRHIYALLEGLKDEDHAAAAAWNMMAFIHTEEMIKRGKLPAELNDMPEPMVVDINKNPWSQDGNNL